MIDIKRRDLLKFASASAALLLLPKGEVSANQAETVYPFSSGLSIPKLKAPPLACDCHHHIYDRRYPYIDNRNLPNALVSSYLKIRERLGLSRSVVIQPSSYGTDNRCMLDALVQLGETARGVAVVTPEVTREKLKEMHEAGVRAIRFNLGAGSVTTPAMIEPLAKRIAEFGWHIEVHLRADELLSIATILQNLPVEVAFDHFGRIPHPAGIEHPAFKLITQLVHSEKAWVKISGAYQDSVLGPPAYDDVKELAQEMINGSSERIVWGTDWPHPSLQTKKMEMPDDATMFDLIANWTQNVAIQSAILVTNPSRLYGF